MRAFLLAVVILSLSSCATNRMVETDLYFGMSKPDGSPISSKEWNDFKEGTLFRVFEKGSTTVEATGNWRDPGTGKLITEQSRLVIFHHEKSKSISRQIDSVCQHYKTLFNQQSVLRVDKNVKVAFL